MMDNKFKTVSLDEMIDKHIGELGTEKREAFENELRIDLLGKGKNTKPQPDRYVIPNIPANINTSDFAWDAPVDLGSSPAAVGKLW